jgi:beta-phosphoglucomutase
MLNNIEAVIFDMDGLMLDTERLDRGHFKTVAAEFGYSDLDHVYEQTVGRNWPDTRKIFLDALGDTFPYDELRERWRRHSLEHAERFGIPVKKGLHELIAFLDARGTPKAVATSTQRRPALAMLERCSILQHFVAVVAGDDVANGKPHPEIFLTAASRLKAAPQRCVVFEDSAAGIQAASAAGMIPILVPDVVVPTATTRALAYRVIESLDQAIALFSNHAEGNRI